MELYGLGSVEDVLLDQRRKALELLEQSLREIHHARRVVPHRARLKDVDPEGFLPLIVAGWPEGSREDVPRMEVVGGRRVSEECLQVEYC